MIDNLPSGMAAGDKHFYPDDSPLCVCGDMADEHHEDGACLVVDCSCTGYEPDPDPTDEELDYA